MLSDYPLNLALATKDLSQARAWYSEKLGFEPVWANDWLLMYREFDCAFTVYATRSAGTAQNTVAIWSVKDLPSAMSRLRGRGVTFEDYDYGDFKTVEGVATDPDDGSLNSWFKDGDGNTWSLFYGPDDDRPERIGPMLAASDLDRSKQWWSEKIGYTPVDQVEGVINLYQSGGKWFSIYATQFAGTAKNTVAGWRVKDLRAEVAALRQRGVVFEDYDFPEFKTQDGIFADPEGDMSAWFVDSEGNTVAINQDSDSGAG